MIFYFWNSILLFTKAPQIEKEGKQYLNIDVRNSKRRLNGIFGIVGWDSILNCWNKNE